MYTYQYLKKCKSSNPRFFYFSLLVFALYALQLLIKTEITPLGYFSLYSNPSPALASYPQILAQNRDDSLPSNIYNSNGTSFLMFEILPSRYQILSSSENCNQMQQKLKSIGISIEKNKDCMKLKNFHEWFRIYAKRRGISLKPDYLLLEYGFKRASIVNSKIIQTE